MSKTMYYVLDDKVEPRPAEDVLAWAVWFETMADRQLVDDTLEDGTRVSTVFLGMDHGFGRREDAPILYETMIFGGPHDGHQERYGHRLDALNRHGGIVKNLKEGREP